jgi:hypothetical protein
MLSPLAPEVPERLRRRGCPLSSQAGPSALPLALLALLFFQCKAFFPASAPSGSCLGRGLLAGLPSLRSEGSGLGFPSIGFHSWRRPTSLHALLKNESSSGVEGGGGSKRLEKGSDGGELFACG